MSFVISRHKFFKDVFFASLAPLFGIIQTLCVVPLITKFMGSEVYGVWVQFGVTVSLASLVIGLNLGHCMYRFLPGIKNQEQLGGVFTAISSIALTISLTIAAGLVIFRAEVASFLFRDMKYSNVVVYLAFFILLEAVFAKYTTFLKARRYFREEAFISIARPLCVTIVLICVTIKTRSISAIIASYVVVQFLMTLGTFIFVHRNIIKIYQPDFKNIPEYLGFGIPLLPVVLGYWIVNTSDRYLIMFFEGASSVGIYSVAYAVASVPVLAMMPVFTVLLPDLSALYDDGHVEELVTRFNRVQKYFFAFGIPSIVGISILSKPLIRLFSTPEFVSAYNIMFVVLPGLFLFVVLHLHTQLLNVLKKTRLLSLVWIGMAGLNFLVNIALIPKIGIMGAGISTLLSYLSGAVIVVTQTRKSFDIRFKAGWLLKIAVCSVLMAVILGFIPADSLVMLITAVFAGVVVYTLCMLAVRFVDKSERLLIKSLFFG